MPQVNQNNNPGCWEAAEVIAQAGGYDAGWPDCRDIPDDDPQLRETPKVIEEMKRAYDPNGAKREKRLEASLRRVERDTMLLAKRKLRDDASV